MRLDHAETDGKAHPGSRSNRFRGKEGLKDSVGDLRLYPRTRVAHFGEHRVCARAGRDGEPTFVEDFAHRVLGIYEQIDEYLNKLVGIGSDLRQPVVKLELYLHASRAERIGHQIESGADNLVEGCRRPYRGALPRHREEGLGYIGATLRRLPQSLDLLSLSGINGVLLEHDRPSDDDRQRVVELMGDA